MTIPVRRLGAMLVVAAWTALVACGPGDTLFPDTSGDPSASGSPGASPSGSPDVTSEQPASGGGARNIVQYQNRQDGRLGVRGNVQLNRAPGPNVQPVNAAISIGMCTDCQTFTVALQINLISRTANIVSPQNTAVAANVGCVRCITVARAIQYTISVDDPTQVPADAQQLVRDMDAELRAIANDRTISVRDANARITALIGRFNALAQDLRDAADEETAQDTPTPSPIPSPTAAPATTSPSVAPSSTSGPSASPSGTP
jgi:hypothetical protein